MMLCAIHIMVSALIYNKNHGPQNHIVNHVIVIFYNPHSTISVSNLYFLLFIVNILAFTESDEGA